MESSTAIILLDRKEDAPEGLPKSATIAYWSSRTDDPSRISIPELTDDSFAVIKKDYLAWTYELGQEKVRGLPLTKYFMYDDHGPSLYDCSRIAEKSPYKCDSIYELFKLQALERLYRNSGARGITYYGSNRTLAKILRTWCATMDHPFNTASTNSKGTRERVSFSMAFFTKLPHALQGALTLLHRLRTRYFSNWKYRPAKNFEKQAGPTIVSYFPNVDIQKFHQGEYWSNYWEKLHHVLDSYQGQINWVWIFGESNQCSYQAALRFRTQCNEKYAGKYRFYLLEDFVTLPVLARAFWGWIRIAIKAAMARSTSRHFCFKNATINFFPLLAKDWRASFFGKEAMDNALYIEIFRSLANVVQAFPWGLFLFEGMAWELALVSAWRRHKLSHTIGYLHSFLRRSDLRAFSDVRRFDRELRQAWPIPDKLIVNGSGNYSILSETETPASWLSIGEATRYLHLGKKFRACRKTIPEKERTLLVILGYVRQDTIFQMNLLAGAAKIGGLLRYERIILKPHPFLPIEEILKDLSLTLNTETSNAPLPVLSELAHVAYSANSTGASFETTWMGLPTICTGTEDSMNLHPFFGAPGYRFVTSANMLAEALNRPVELELPNDYFFLDSRLENWSKLLNSAAPTTQTFS